MFYAFWEFTCNWSLLLSQGKDLEFSSLTSRVIDEALPQSPAHCIHVNKVLKHSMLSKEGLTGRAGGERGSNQKGFTEELTFKLRFGG